MKIRQGLIAGSVIALIGALFFFFPAKKAFVIHPDVPIAREKPEMENEDGVMLAQQQEFEMTKDVKLGYVPKERLTTAYQKMMTARRLQLYSPYGVNGIAALSWTERGPNSDAAGPFGNGRPGNGATSGRMRAILVDRSDATNKTVWVGGIDGGLWKTTDVTASSPVWNLVNDFFGNLAIASIAQDSTTPGTMYFGTGEKAFNADAVKGGGVWKSTDHGVTWNLLPSTVNFWNVSKVAVDKNGFVYVATIGSGAGIQRSTDGGTTWTTITPTGLSTRVTEMRISVTGRMHIVCGYYNTAAGSAGYRYSDRPDTVSSNGWVSPVTPFAPSQYNEEIAVAGNNLYVLNANASFQTPQVYKSTDGGANWAATATSPPAASANNDLSSGQGWYNLAIAVDPANPNNVIVGGLNCYRSTNGGASWSQVSVWVSGISGTVTNYIHADQHYMTWNGNQVLVGSDGGLFYSGDGGATFADRNNGLRLKQFYSCAIHPTLTNYFLGGAQDNGSHQFSHAGLGATTEVTGGDGAFTHIDQDQPNYQFTSYIYNQYFRSLDGGNTWNYINLSNNTGLFINPTDYDDVNNKLYMAGTSGHYYRWEDPQTGQTLSSVAVPAFGAGTVTSVKVSPYSNKTVFFGNNFGKVYKVTNSESASPTATDISGGGMSATTVSCVATGTDENNLLAVFSNYGSIHVWATTTGGGVGGWTNISGNLPDIPVRWAMFYPEDNTKALIATEMGVYETALINGASTNWTLDPSFPVVRTDMLKYRKSDGLVAAATHGRGLWTANFALTTPYIRFASGYANLAEASASGSSGCRGFTDYTATLTIDAAPVGAATATISVAGGGTATQGVDYDFTTNGNFASPSNVLTFANGAVTPQTVTIRVYDDGDVEGTENFTLNLGVSGVTNAQAAPSGSSFTVSITSSNTAPALAATGVSATIGSGDYGSYPQPFRSDNKKSKSQYIYLASELRAAGLTAGNITSVGFNVQSKTSTLPYSGLNISLKNTSTTSFASTSFEPGATNCFSASYSTVSGVNTINLSTPFAWDGVSNLLVEFCYDNATASGTGDQVSTNTTVDAKGIWNASNAGVGCSLAAAFNATAEPFFVRPDLTFKVNTTGNTVESTLNANNTQYLGPNHNTYFYNGSHVIAQIQSSGAFDYGCTVVTVDRAGTGTSPFYSAAAANQLMNKTFHVVPGTNNPSGTYTITLYFTAAEKAGWETATGNTWANIQLVKVAGQISQVTPGTPNGAGAVTVVTPTFGTFGTDYTLSYSFTNGFSGFGAGIPGSALPITLLDFSGNPANGNIQLNWSTSSEQNSKNFTLEKSLDGVTYYPIGTIAAAGNSQTTRHYGYTDKQVSELNYYRLAFNDLDGHSITSRVVLVKQAGIPQKVWVNNNPFRDYIDTRLARLPQGSIRFQLTSLSGKLVYDKLVGPTQTIHLDLSGKTLSSGAYVLSAQVDGKIYSFKLVRQ